MLADGSEEGEERWANLLELREVTTRYDDLSAEDALDRLLEETALVADQDSYQSDADMLSLITLHAAKGLEFEVVFVAGLEESLFPTGRAVEAEGGFNPDPRPMEEERRLAYVGMTRARQRLYLSHAWQRATRRGPGTSWMAEPSRFLMEIPADLMNGPRLVARPEDGDTPAYGTDDLNLVFGRGATRFGRPIRPGGGAFREGSGRPGAPSAGETFRPSRDLQARRDAFAGGARSGTFGRRGAVDAWEDDVPARDRGRRRFVRAQRRRIWPGTRGGAAIVNRPVIPGERRYRDGDRVRHSRWGDGIVVSSKLTRSDEEVTIAFRDPQIGRKTLLASLAGLEAHGLGRTRRTDTDGRADQQRRGPPPGACAQSRDQIAGPSLMAPNKVSVFGSYSKNHANASEARSTICDPQPADLKTATISFPVMLAVSTPLKTTVDAPTSTHVVPNSSMYLTCARPLAPRIVRCCVLPSTGSLLVHVPSNGDDEPAATGTAMRASTNDAPAITPTLRMFSLPGIPPDDPESIAGHSPIQTAQHFRAGQSPHGKVDPCAPPRRSVLMWTVRDGGTGERP